MIIEAHIFFFVQTSDGYSSEQSHVIHYVSGSVKEGIVDAIKWAKRRQKVLPDIFGQILCIKLYYFNPLPLDDSGDLRPFKSLPFFEWKYDTAEPLEVIMERHANDSGDFVSKVGK